MDLPDVTAVLQESKKVLKQCFTQYETDEVFLSFNGGKDCTVLLDIVINVLNELNKVASDLKVVYIRTKGPFSEIESFVERIVQHYGVKLLVTEGEMKETLRRLLNEDGKLKACLMGTRSTDPYSEDLKFMQKTDPSWPQILRVSPILKWSYHHVWSYILSHQVPYCSLYDAGYTSLGSVQNTKPNPALAYTDRDGCISYHPAWMLSDPTQERAGRGTTNITNNTQLTCKSDANGVNGHAEQNGNTNDIGKEYLCNGDIV